MENHYQHALEGEARHWDTFVAQRLLGGEIPGSVDFRLFFTQFAMRLGWRPPCLGPIEITFRRRELRYVLERAVPRRGVRVLDLGCGAGWLSLELARRGADVTAVDVSPGNLALARYTAETNARNFPYLYQPFVGLTTPVEQFGRIEYVNADLNAIDLPAHEYDAVVVWDSLHHVAQLERLLEQVKRTLKPDGVFVGLDHADVGSRTITFSDTLTPIVRDAYGWITAHNPAWLYDGVERLAHNRDWGVLAVDDNVRPIAGSEAFFERVRTEMLDVLRPHAPLDQLTPSTLDFVDTGQSETSPFEDVSAGRLMRSLLDTFSASRFETVCPILLHRDLMPEPRSPGERVFQHYVCALLVSLGERAIARGETDGQWFLFDLSPAAPPDHQADRLLHRDPDPAESHIRNLTDLVERLRHDLDLRQTHVENLEAIIAARRTAADRGED